MASPFSLEKGGKVGREKYQETLAKEMKRYHGDRDRAVRSANIASGFGNSTAERFKGKSDSGRKEMGGGGGGGGQGIPKKAGPPKSKAAQPITNVPTPTPRPTNFSPDLAPSTNPFQMNSPVGPSPMDRGAPTGPPMGNPQLGAMQPPMPNPQLMAMQPPPLGNPQLSAMQPPMPNPQLMGMQPNPSINIGPAGGQKRPATFPGMQPPIFNDYGFKSEPQDPNEPWWKHMLRG